VQGLPEPRVKRTVEGDLGMRHNAATIVDVAGLDAIARDAQLPQPRVGTLLAQLCDDVERLPESVEERALDHALVRAAVRHAVLRHCGTVETVYTVVGPALVQHGKDLSQVAAVVGTGGALVHSPDPRAVLDMALATASAPQALLPRTPKLLLDRHYLLYACGLLSTVEPRAALELALANLDALERKPSDERTLAA